MLFPTTPERARIQRLRLGLFILISNQTLSVGEV